MFLFFIAGLHVFLFLITGSTYFLDCDIQSKEEDDQYDFLYNFFSRHFLSRCLSFVLIVIGNYIIIILFQLL